MLHLRAKTIHAFSPFLLTRLARSLQIMEIITFRIFEEDIVPFLIFASIIILSFEFAFSFFSWINEVTHVSGSFFDMFTELGDFSFLARHTVPYKLPTWDNPDASITMVALWVKVLFFIVTVVVLLNLLIAMMSQTYSDVYSVVKQEYQMGFAKIVKEYFDAPTSPLPLNVVECAIDEGVGRCAKGGTISMQPKKIALHRWGRHFTWPVSSLSNRLMEARRKVAVKRTRLKQRKMDEKDGRL
eukprot:SAG31_NODE_1395_length_8516_cov_4.162885_4_plen_242_part_00